MQLLYKGYVFLLLQVSAMMLLLAIYSLIQHRGVKVRYFACALLAISVMSLSSVFSALSSTVEMADFWLSKVRFIGVIFSPVFFLLFVMADDRVTQRLPSWLMRFLLILPVISLAIVWTNGLHGLFIERISYGRYGDFLFRETWKPGLWFWAHTIYCYVILIYVAFLLFRKVCHSRYPRRSQAVLMFIAWIFPVLSNAIALTQRMPGPALDLTSFGLTVTALAFFWAMYHYRLLHILPMAGEQILENMQDGVIVLDDQERVIHVNLAMLKLLGNTPRDMVAGVRVEEILPNWLSLHSLEQGSGTCRKPAEATENEVFFQINSAPLFRKRKNTTIGKIVLLHDITELTNTMQEKEKLIVELREIQSELEVLATTDPLTSLYNRRYFFQSAQQEFKRSIRYQRPLSMIMADIDYFKLINDRYGHSVGDGVLVMIAIALKRNVRKVDILARFGGEEFIILLPETELSAARCLAQRILQAVRKDTLQHEGENIAATVSIGVASLDSGVNDLETLVNMADDALYQAKGNGRDRVCVRECGKDALGCAVVTCVTD